MREIRDLTNSHAIHPYDDAESVALGFAAAKISGLPLLLGQPGLAADLPDRIRVRAVGSGAEWDAQRGQDSLAHTNFSVGMFTSGSTGGPKLVLHDVKSTDYQAKITAQAMSVNIGEVAVVALPMDHAYGFSVLNAAWMSSFTTLHVSPLARSTLVSLLRSGRVASLDSIAPVWDYLLRASRSDDLLRTRLVDLRLRGVGGQMLSTRLETAWAEMDAPLNNGYGLTEAGPNVAINVTSGYRPGSVGRPLPEVEVRVASDGELLVRSPSVARHLWQGGLQRNLQIDESGWLSTGDAASVSTDGYVSIMGRKDSIVIQRSKKLAIEAIEDAINLDAVSGAYTFVVKSGRRSDGSDKLMWLFAHVLDADVAQELLESSLRLVPTPFAFSDGKVIGRDPHSLRTPAGKPRRDLILELLLSDSDR